jgi:protein-S-isoprenylcysteine O-methyltransferase Ste14
MLLAALVIFRVLVSRSYKKWARLTPLATLLESLYWGPAFAFPYLYNGGSWPAFWVCDADIARWMQFLGSALIVIGAGSVVGVITYLGLSRSFGQQVDRLRVTGPYRMSRNPQIVCGLLLILGIAVRWPSWYAVGWVGLMGAALHMMVLTEEEHLGEVFGPEYAKYCRRVPRYIGVGRGRGDAAA